MEYQIRHSHFSYHRDGGSFIVTSERDENFQRNVQLGSVISQVAQRSSGNPFEAHRTIHEVLYAPMWKEFREYERGDAPAHDDVKLDRGNQGNGNGNN